MYVGNDATQNETGGYHGLREDGEATLDEVSTGADGRPEGGGNLRVDDQGSSEAGPGGTRRPGKRGSADVGGHGDSAEGVHTEEAGNQQVR